MSLAALALSIDLNDARYAWRAYGACVSEDPELFFPTRGEDTSAAKAICAHCPVKDVCLEVAIVNGEKFGIWGGLSERERRRLRKARRLEAPDGRVEKVDTGDRILAQLEQRGGTWWATTAQIARACGCTESTARQVIGTLRRNEVITVTKKKDAFTGANKPTLAAIHLNHPEGTTP